MEQVIRRGQIYLMNFGKHHGSVRHIPVFQNANKERSKAEKVRTFD